MSRSTVDSLPARAGAALCEIAAESIRHEFERQAFELPAPEMLDPSLATAGATFVTLTDVDETLLGCIGSLEALRPVAHDVADHAVQAAFHDPRMPPLSRAQFVRMTVEISVLSPLEELGVTGHHELVDTLRPWVDGVVIEVGVHRATFLPAVWEKLDGVDEFLDLLWRKAGLEPRTWPEALSVRRYTTQSFDARGPRTPIER